MVLRLCVIMATQPRLLRDPKALPFGHIPPEGIKPTPPPVKGRDARRATKDKEDAAKEQATPPADEMAKPAKKKAAKKAKCPEGKGPLAKPPRPGPTVRTRPLPSC